MWRTRSEVDDGVVVNKTQAGAVWWVYELQEFHVGLPCCCGDDCEGGRIGIRVGVVKWRMMCGFCWKNMVANRAFFVHIEGRLDVRVV